MNGFLNILKPPGMTSSDVVVHVRRLLPRGVKVGHAGTLDPMAAGVLPIMVGKATRLFDHATGTDKEYVAALRFGIATDTQDQTGRITGTSDARPTGEALAAALPAFTGEISQIPPAYSALKQDGQKLYELARKGVIVEKPPRRVRIDALELVERVSREEALLRVVCGKGTYIRTLCYDLGQRLGVPAHMGFLLRTRVGVFRLEDAAALEDLTPESLAGLLTPQDFSLGHLPFVRVRAAGEAACRNGNPLTQTLMEEAVEDLPEGVSLRVYLGDRFAGLGRREGQTVRFEAMLLESVEDYGN